MFPEIEARDWILLALQPAALAIWHWQKRPGALGGPISLIKALWLTYAISLWIVVPFLSWRDHPVFAVWAVSMGIRTIAEIPLCLTKRWRVTYGVAHDLIHLALVVAGWIWAPQLWIVAALTAVSLATELLFVRWFKKRTAGPGEGVYFVPGGEAHRDVNRKTAWIFLPQYAAFLSWLLV